MLATWVKKAVEVRDDELGALGWAFWYHFCLMAGYYILQPVRDAFGIQDGGDDLPALFILSMVLMLVANPVYATLVDRLPRYRLIPLVYRFFMLNLLAFYGLLLATSGPAQRYVAQGFFLWVGIFNLFAVSVFWSYLADLFRADQGKRLFGFIGAGGTAGQLVGSLVTGQAAQRIGPINLLLATVVLLEAAVYGVARLSAIFDVAGRAPVPGEKAPDPPASPEGGAWDGIRLILRSPYLGAICLYMFLYTFTSSFLYFEKAAVVKAAFTDSGARTAYFAQLNLLVGALTVGVQLFVTGRLIASMGVSLALALVPALTVLGFGALGTMPVLIVLASFDVLRKSANYAIARPAREILYTVVDRREKYASKSLIDTFVYRGGDALAAGAFQLLGWFQLGFSGVAFAAIPFSALWLVNGLWLGRRQQELAAARTG